MTALADQLDIGLRLLDPLEWKSGKRKPLTSAHKKKISDALKGRGVKREDIPKAFRGQAKGAGSAPSP